LNIEPILTYAEQQQSRYLGELKAFLRIPSVSTQPERSADVARAARWLADTLTTAGLENVRILQTGRHPLVYADWLHAGADRPTVLIYGHYDVQPAEPIAEWVSPPFEPEVREDYLYARGASDDKGQLFIHVKAIEAYLAATGRLPVNVKCLFEGEEESGGESIAAFVPENTDLLAADAALISDTAMVDRFRPAIVYGLRGMCYILMDLFGPGRDLHSGSYGGAVNNPLNALAHIIAQLKDEQGRVLIPGFYDRVRSLSAEERQVLAAFPLDRKKWLADTGVPQPWGEPDYTLTERLGARPTLDVNGLVGGYTGPGSKTVLPNKGHAKISMRLVPDQDPDEIRELFVRYVDSLVPPSLRLEYTFRGGSWPVIVHRDTPAVRAAARAAEEVFAHPAVFMREGGTIPVVIDFQQYLGADPVLLGFGLAGDNIHAPNERFFLPHFYAGVATSIRFLHHYAQNQ
jgi:acetylornithine deacetylase/succinyl-diaminopimelate desuccinylase-like protein